MGKHNKKSSRLSRYHYVYSCQKQEENGACCCNCRYHKEVHIHCSNVLSKYTDTGCVCDVQIDWACLAPEFDCIFAHWGEHGICEMWEDANRSCDNCANKGKECDKCAYMARIIYYRKADK